MVNVVIPLYWSHKTLPKTLDSLVAQTKTMFLVTLVQDSDGADYSEIIEEYERRGLHIRCVSTDRNGGPGYARQRGIDADEMCDYVMFCDADDLLMPNAIETLYNEAKKNRLDVLISDFLAERNHEPNIQLHSSTTPITWTHGKIYRTQYLRENNIRFRDDLRLNEDAYFNLVAINCTQNKKKISECTYLWRDNPDSITRKGGHNGFFNIAWKGYVYGQIKAVEKIIDVTGDIDCSLLAATLINVYRHIMAAVHKKYDLGAVKAYCEWLKDMEKVQEKFDTPEFWEYIHKNLNASEYIEEVLVFYDIKFSVWIREWCKK